MAKKTSRGRKQDRARVAGGQDYEVRYEASKTGSDQQFLPLSLSVPTPGGRGMAASRFGSWLWVRAACPTTGAFLRSWRLGSPNS